MWRDHPHRAAVQDAADILGRVRRHAHQRGDADLLRRDADLAGGVDRQRVVLHIHIQRVEAGGLGDLRDLDRAAQADGHRGDDLAARQFLFCVVAQNVA